MGIRVGSVALDDPVILAPMSGVTDLPFRRLVKRHGAALVVSEMIASQAAIRGLMRNLGGSVGIPVLVAELTVNTQTVHSRLVEALRPDNPMAQPSMLGAHYSLTAPAGIAALNAEVTRQAAMVAYIDDFKMMMLAALLSIPLILLLRRSPPERQRDHLGVARQLVAAAHVREPARRATS